MKRPRLALLAGVVVLTSAASAGAEPSRSVCPKVPGRIVAQSAFVDVYRGRQKPRPRYIALDRSTCQQYVMAFAYDDFTGQVRVSGHYVAWYRVDSEEAYPQVAVIDARKGSHAEASYFPTYDNPQVMGGDLAAFPRLTDLIVAPDGGVAWISRRQAPDLALEVHYGSYSKPGSDPLLDAAPDVVPGSLALGRHDLYWQRGDSAYTAPRATQLAAS